MCIRDRFQGTGTTLLIIGRNPRFSPFLPQQPPQAAQAVGLKKIEDQLQGKKWRVANRYGFSGPLSLFLGTINRFFINLNRHDLLDRNNAAIRKYALVQGRSAYYSPLWGMEVLN
jgi:hypothetical protein